MPDFVTWFRGTSPYIHAHRGHTFVITFGGEALESSGFDSLIHDIALLGALGVRVVLVHGARPQIEERLNQRNADMFYENGIRVTDSEALICVKEAAGAVRVEIEALLSMGVANSPMAGARIRVASGNFVTARPIGVRHGIDYQHTGRVRRVDVAAIDERLDSGAIVLIPPIGYSPTGEVFNLTAAETASEVAVAIGADKLIALVEGKGLRDQRRGIISSLTPAEGEKLLKRRKSLSEDLRQHLAAAIDSCRRGVRRCHLIRRDQDGALLSELFTRDGAGTLISGDDYQHLRAARIDDVIGILELLRPLEESGALVRRSRELLETEIDRFVVIDRDGMIIGCAALYPYPDEQVGELACLAVHDDYRGRDVGQQLLDAVQRIAREQHLRRLVVLTTQTSQWFQERGFRPASLSDLPHPKRDLYNYRRNSKIFIKPLD